MNKNKFLVKNTILYSISTFSTKIISFFMVSFYTSVLSVEIYGKIDIIFGTISLMIPVIALSINNAVLRFLLDKDSNKNNIFGIGYFITMIGSIFVICFSYIINIWLKNEYLMLISILLILEIWYLLFSDFIRGLERNEIYVFSNILLVFLISIFNFIMLGYYNLKIYGYLYSYILAYGIICIIFILFIHPLKLLKKIQKKEFCNLFKEMLKFSVYLIPNSIFWWITISSDKYIIVYLLGSSFNGIYSVANKIPTIVTYTFQIFIQAWQLSAIKELGNESEKEFVNSVFDKLYFLLILTASFLLIIVKPFIAFYVDKSYYISWQSAAILIVTSIFNVLSAFVGIRYIVVKKNKRNMYTTFLGAIINILLNIIMIPKFKLIGAAIATLISYLVVFIMRIIDTKKYLFIRIPKQHYIFWGLLLAQLITLYFTSIVSVSIGIALIIFVIITNITSLKIIFKHIRRKK